MNMYPNNPLTIGQANFNPYYTSPINQVVPNYPTVQQTSPHMEIPCVNGRESAYAYVIGPNSSVILVDNLEPKIWMVKTDSSGFKAVKGFRIIPEDEPEVAEPIEAKPSALEEQNEQMKALTERLDKLEERLNSYGQSNSRSSWQNKSGNGNNQSNDRNGHSSKGSNGSSKPDGHE